MPIDPLIDAIFSLLGVPHIELKLNAIRQTTCAVLATLCLQYYEWAIKFDDEVDLIYSAPWSLIKVAYLLCRYTPMVVAPLVAWTYVGHITYEECKSALQLVYALLIPLQLFPQAVMMIRTYALVRQRWVLLLLCVSYIAITVSTAFTFIGMDPLPIMWYKVLREVPCLPDCNDPTRYPKIVTWFTTTAVGNLICLGLIIYYCLRESIRHLSIVRHFVTQGVLFFAVITSIHISSTAIFFTQQSFANVGVPIAPILSNIIACRVILALKASNPSRRRDITEKFSLTELTNPTSLQAETRRQDDWLVSETNPDDDI